MLHSFSKCAHFLQRLAVYVTGREDIDVRMLGDGRPFVMEIQNQRASMPPPERFAAMEYQLEEVSQLVSRYSALGLVGLCLSHRCRQKLHSAHSQSMRP